MTTSTGALDRARVWLTQGRHDRAEEALRACLAEDPEDARALALLALTLVALDRGSEAEQAAVSAIGRAPDEALPHYSHAVALEHRGKLREARQAIEGAIRIDPRDPDAWTLSGQIFLGQRRWPEAREAAERALEIDPQHVGAINVRARALAQSGRGAETDVALAQALSRDPENAATHSNVGWTLLQRGNCKQAREHFLEALRLEPGHATARTGLIESIKARNRLYRGMLGVFFWLGKQQKRSVWAVLIGLWIVPRALRALARSQPELAPFVFPVVLAIMVFVFLTWIIEPLFNLALFFHPVGRHALNRREKAGAAAVSGCLGLGLLLLGASALVGQPRVALAGLASLTFVLPLSAAFGMENPRYRRMAAIGACVLGVLALSGCVALFLGSAEISIPGVALLAVYLLGVVGMTWLVNLGALAGRTD